MSNQEKNPILSAQEGTLFNHSKILYVVAIVVILLLGLAIRFYDSTQLDNFIQLSKPGECIMRI